MHLKLTFTENEPQRSTTLIAKVFGSSWYSHSGLPDVRFYRYRVPNIPELPVPALLDAHDDAQWSTGLLLEDLAEQYVPSTLPITEDWPKLLADVLIDPHAAWWQSPRVDALEFSVPEQGRPADAASPKRGKPTHSCGVCSRRVQYLSRKTHA